MTRTVVLIALLSVASSAQGDGKSIHNFAHCLGKPKQAVAKMCKDSGPTWPPNHSGARAALRIQLAELKRLSCRYI